VSVPLVIELLSFGAKRAEVNGFASGDRLLRPSKIFPNWALAGNTNPRPSQEIVAFEDIMT
jgi:hypothetical protein